MSFKVDKNIPTLERKFHYLLHELCVDLGFCLPPDDWERIARLKQISANEFAAEVLRAESMNPEYEQKWVREISERFVSHFGADEVIEERF